MKFKLFKKYTIFLTVIILLAPAFVFADPGITINPNVKCGEIERDDEGKIIETPPCLTAPGISEGKTSDFTDLLQWFLSFMLYAAGILAVFMLVVGGVQYVLAGSMGNPEKIGDAQSRLLSALGGLVLALGAWIILNTINPKLLNIDVNLKYIPTEQNNPGGPQNNPGGPQNNPGGPQNNPATSGNASGNEEYVWQQNNCASDYSQGGDKCFGSIGNPPGANYVCCKKNK